MFITLMSIDEHGSEKGWIHVNINHIGHFYRVEERKARGTYESAAAHTRVGVTTHNNGGFRVKETPAEIAEAISMAQRHLDLAQEK